MRPARAGHTFLLIGASFHNRKVSILSEAQKKEAEHLEERTLLFKILKGLYHLRRIEAALLLPKIIATNNQFLPNTKHRLPMFYLPMLPS